MNTINNISKNLQSWKEAFVKEAQQKKPLFYRLGASNKNYELSRRSSWIEIFESFDYDAKSLLSLWEKTSKKCGSLGWNETTYLSALPLYTWAEKVVKVFNEEDLDDQATFYISPTGGESKVKFTLHKKKVPIWECKITAPEVCEEVDMELLTISFSEYRSKATIFCLSYVKE